MKRKEREYVFINGNAFEVVKKEESIYYAGNSLYDCYCRPSQRKVAIFEEWKNDFYTERFNNGGILDFNMWVSSYNSNIFTLAGNFRTEQHNYNFKITPSRNICWIAD